MIDRSRRIGLRLAGVAVILLELVVVLNIWKRPPEVVPELPLELPAVLVNPVAAVVVRDRLLVSGEVVAWASATLAAEKPGQVSELSAEKGSDVERGEVLVGIDAESWEQELALVGIEAEDAAREFNRWKTLKQTGAVAESEYDTVARRHSLAQVRLAQARLQVERCAVRAPFRGRVDERYVELGEYLSEGQVVCRVVDTKRLKVAARVPERDIAGVAVGDSVTFDVAALEGCSYTGRVMFVALEADAATHAYRVEAEVEGELSALRPGMIAEVAFVREGGQKEIAVPLSAVVPHKGDHVVFVVDNGVAEQRVVRIARLSGELAVLQSGVVEGDRLVVEGQRLLRDGSRVQVVASEQELAH